MTELLILRGLPASGKTTFAKQWVTEDVERRSRVNRDELRETLHDGFQGPNEVAVSKCEHALISTLLAVGRSVVVDNTNLKARYVRTYAELAHEAGTGFELKDFEVPIDEMVERDVHRIKAGERGVGEQIIREMATRFHIGPDGNLPVLPELDGNVNSRLYVPNPTRHQVIQVDIDGTVALHDGRSPYDYSRVSEDLPHRSVIRLVQDLMNHAGYGVVFLSGRPESCRADTEDWLRRHVGTNFNLFMRQTGDGRSDDIIKVELFNEHVRDRYHVIAVFDDRNRVVRAWRKIGLTCLQVADGAF